MGQPLIASCGLGVNSTAMCVGFCEYGIRPDALLFADTGGEKPETYDFLRIFDAWLKANGLPPLTVLHKDSMYASLEDNCLRTETLPSKVSGGSSCSDKWKQEPQRKWLNHWQPAIDCWAAGGKVRKAIGFDLEEEHRAAKAPSRDEKCELWFPLIEWEWGRRECLAAIERAGLAVPVKSACFFCPSAKKKEVLDLAERHPDLFNRAVAMERTAAPNCTTVKGLGRHWSWEEIVKADRMELLLLPEAEEQHCACYDGED